MAKSLVDTLRASGLLGSYPPAKNITPGGLAAHLAKS